MSEGHLEVVRPPRPPSPSAPPPRTAAAAPAKTHSKGEHTVLVKINKNEKQKKKTVRVLSTVPHVAIAHGRHGDDRPPERVRDRFEGGTLDSRLRKVHYAGEQYHAWEHGSYKIPSTFTVLYLYLRIQGQS